MFLINSSLDVVAGRNFVTSAVNLGRAAVARSGMSIGFLNAPRRSLSLINIRHPRPGTVLTKHGGKTESDARERRIEPHAYLGSFMIDVWTSYLSYCCILCRSNRL